MKYLAIIPARKGSKGLPGKNFRDFAGHPLIYHTIQAAKESSLISNIFISSDDDRVLELGKEMEIEYSIKRPDELCLDTSPITDTYQYVINYLEERALCPENLILLQPTSPLRNGAHIDEAIKLFEEEGKDCCISVSKMSEHPYECIYTNDGESWEYLRQPQNSAKRRQDYKEEFHFLNGAIYITKTTFFKRENKLTEIPGAAIYPMDSIQRFDIDNEADFLAAEACYHYLNK